MTDLRRDDRERVVPEDEPAATSSSRPRIGVSTCLLGEEVRHDGGHKHDRFVTGVLAEHLELVPVCPEMEVGMGTPREALRLVRQGDDVRMITVKTEVDWTARMRDWSKQRLEELAARRLDGFLLKKNSPSCGMERVKVYDANGVPSRDGSGLFATALMDRFPLLPVEEEGRLNDPGLRENFILRVFTHQRFRRLVSGSPAPADLVRFHTRHKMLLLAHDTPTYRELGRLVATAGGRPLEPLLEEYTRRFMTAIGRPAKPGRHVNVLHHLCGFVKKDLDAEAKAELLAVIEDYGNGLVPLVTPLTLLQHHLRRAGHPWVDEQIYLEPYPRELALRSVR